MWTYFGEVFGWHVTQQIYCSASGFLSAMTSATRPSSRLTSTMAEPFSVALDSAAKIADKVRPNGSGSCCRSGS